MLTIHIKTCSAKTYTEWMHFYGIMWIWECEKCKKRVVPVKINLSNVPTGLYSVQIVFGNKTSYEKLSCIFQRSIL